MLKIQNLTVRFGTSATPVVEDVSLTLRPGEKTAIIGETGSGKSVMLLSVLRLLPGSAVVTGQVSLDDQELLQLPIEKMYDIRGTKIGYIPQCGGTSLNPLMTIGRQLDEAMRLNKGMKASQRRQAVIEMLRYHRLGDEEKLVRQYPHQLSGGMRQRVLIIMGLCTNAPYVFADEPTKGVDTAYIRLITDTLSNLGDQSLLCVTHDILFAQAIADQICVMYAAQQVELGPAEDVFAHPLHPYTQAMIRALPENGAQATMGFAPPHNEFSQRGCRFYDRCTMRKACCQMPPPMVQVDNRKVRCWLYAD